MLFYRSPHSNPLYADSQSIFNGSEGGSSSSNSISTPITPLTHPSDLLYPLDFHPEPLDFSQLDPQLHDPIDAWTNADVVLDAEATPRVNADGQEKSLAQVESQFVHA